MEKKLTNETTYNQYKVTIKIIVACLRLSEPQAFSFFIKKGNNPVSCVRKVLKMCSDQWRLSL